MPNITPIQQLSTARRTAHIYQMSLLISKKISENVIIASNLSTNVGKSLELITNLKEIEELTEEMNNLTVVTKYLTVKFLQFIGINLSKECIILTCAQLKIAIKEVIKQIKLIKIQPDKKSHREELNDTKKLLKKLLIKYKKCC